MAFTITVEQAAKTKGISLYALAKKMDVKPNFFSVMKHPGYNPKLSTLLHIQKVLGCDITELYKFDGRVVDATKKAPAKKSAAKAKPKFAGGSKKKAVAKKTASKK